MISDILLTTIANSVITALGENPIMKFFSGQAPDTVETPSTNPLVEMVLPTPQFNETTKHIEFGDTIAGNVLNTGTATFFQIYNNNNIPLIQGTIGTSGTNIVLENVDLVAPGIITLSNFYIQVS